MLSSQARRELIADANKAAEILGDKAADVIADALDLADRSAAAPGKPARQGRLLLLDNVLYACLTEQSPDQENVRDVADRVLACLEQQSERQNVSAIKATV